MTESNDRRYKVWVGDMPLADEFTSWEDAAELVVASGWGTWNANVLKLNDDVRIKALPTD